MSKIAYRSKYLDREVRIPVTLKDDIINIFLKMSKHTFFMKRPEFDYFNESRVLKNKYGQDYPGRYRFNWDYEVFEEFATKTKHEEFKNNQRSLEQILENCAHRLDVIGLSDRNVGLEGVKFDETHFAFAQWLEKQKNNQKLPHYNSFFAFHVERLAQQAMLENKSISDWNSLSPAILRRVEEHPEITIYAHHYKGANKDHTPKMYLDALRIFSSPKTIEAIQAIINKRRCIDKNKAKIQAENINPSRVKESSGISEVMAEASGQRPRKQRQIIGGGKAKKPQKPTPWSFPSKKP